VPNSQFVTKLGGVFFLLLKKNLYPPRVAFCLTQLGEVLAGFHYDLNFLTIHGKSRFPALNIFLRDGCNASQKKMAVKVFCQYFFLCFKKEI
jgi:hypothetical protein